MISRDRLWPASLAGCCLAAGVWAGFAPLADPDLPMHLAVGEWIVANNRLPFEEPFAWTRAGEPYYAYSWIAQVAFYAAIGVAGPLGLHLLSAVAAVAIVLAGWMVGRSMQLAWPGSVLLGALSTGIAMESTPFLRPQLLMHALIPLAWASAFWVVRTRSVSPVYPALVLWLTSALAAGIHITFPVAAAPLVLLAARADRIDVPRLSLAAGAILLGWLTSPYAPHWPAVFSLNLGYNAITAGLSPAGELAPGFSVSPLVGAGLAALPFFVHAGSTRIIERMALAALWLAGLVVFARYFKGLSPWWWCALPLVAAALRRMPAASDHRVELTWAVLVPAVVLAFSPTNIRLWQATRIYEGGLESRMLPSIKAFAAEPAASWLEAHVKIPHGTRLLTTFNYGSYLKWRLPALSQSIDSRGVFPDSAALPDVPSASAQRPVGPWMTSQIAVVPVTYPVAPLLDADPNWRRIGTAVAPPWAPAAPKVGLWVRKAWLRANQRAEIADIAEVDSLRPHRNPR